MFCFRNHSEEVCLCDSCYGQREADILKPSEANRTPQNELNKKYENEIKK